MLQALEQIRPMRAGAQSHLMRCDDGYYDVVKFQNNPRHTRVLVNDRHRFVRDTLREAGIVPLAMEGFAVWVAKLKPMIQ